MTAPREKKLLAGFLLKVRVALICVALLVVGAWLRPPEPGAIAATEERPAPLLEERVERRQAAAAPAIQDLGTRLAARGLVITTAPERPVLADDFGGTSPRDAAFGVAVAGEYLLTHEAALSGASAASVMVAPTLSAPATVVAFDPPTGLTLLRVNATLQTAIIATATPNPGVMAAAAASVAGRDVIVPVFITSIATDRYDISGGASLAAGMPIFNADGNLLAVAGGDGSAAPVRDALPRLLAIAGGQPAPSSIGVAWQPIDDRLRSAFGDAGVVVVSVVDGGPADRAGIRTGDVLLSIGSTALSAADAARALSALPPGSAVDVQLRRGERTQTISVTPDTAYAVRALARERANDGLAAAALFPAAALQSAGVPEGASVVSIDGRAVSTEREAARELARARGNVTVLVDAGGRRFFAVLPPK